MRSKSVSNHKLETCVAKCKSILERRAEFVLQLSSQQNLSPRQRQAKVVKMFAGQFSPTGSLDIDDTSDTVTNNAPPPKSFLGKCKYYYDKYKLHRISASVLLILYSFLGAWCSIILSTIMRRL
uniref:Transmembrane protein n=1 Tax=Caenorhabditis japonica TaxID=281687 RepID=A0A8R1EVJ1_CAEJA